MRHGAIVRTTAVLACLWAATATASEPALVIEAAGETRRFTRSALLARPDLTRVEVAVDVAYGGPAAYRAVPAAALFAGLAVEAGDAIEFRALDGFSASLDSAVLLNRNPAAAVAWVAVEPADGPWRPLPKKADQTAGPFYLVWTNPAASAIGPEQWPYQLAALAVTQPVEARFPQVLVDRSLPADAPARAGQAVFLKQCFACHRMNGGGTSELGPDLNRPMNPTEYFQPAALRRYLRDPAAVRTWPGQIMPGFAPDVLPDTELDQLIGYLRHMAGRKAR